VVQRENECRKREDVRIILGIKKKKLAEIFFLKVEGAETRTRDLSQAIPNFSESITKQATFTFYSICTSNSI